jgi:hypothetical protein
MIVLAAVALPASPAKAQGCWSDVPGKALDIEIGADGSVWSVISAYKLGHWNGTGWTEYDNTHHGFVMAPYYTGTGPGLAVSPTGELWVVDMFDMTMWRLTGGSWQQVAGPPARTVGIGGDGSVWMIDYDMHLRHWTGTDWTVVDTPLPLATLLVKVDATGAVWVEGYVDNTGSSDTPMLLRLADGVWQRFPAGDFSLDLAVDGGAADRPLAWRTREAGDSVEHYVGGQWVRDTTVPGYNVAVSPDGQAWVTLGSDAALHSIKRYVC